MHKHIDGLIAALRIPNLAGVKFTYENMMDFQECMALENGRYDMLFGRDEMLLCGLALGARGGVGSTYNFAATLHLDIILVPEGNLPWLHPSGQPYRAMARALARRQMENNRGCGQKGG